MLFAHRVSVAGPYLRVMQYFHIRVSGVQATITGYSEEADINDEFPSYGKNIRRNERKKGGRERRANNSGARNVSSETDG